MGKQLAKCGQSAVTVASCLGNSSCFAPKSSKILELSFSPMCFTRFVCTTKPSHERKNLLPTQSSIYCNYLSTCTNWIHLTRAPAFLFQLTQVTTYLFSSLCFLFWFLIDILSSLCIREFQVYRLWAVHASSNYIPPSSSYNSHSNSKQSSSRHRSLRWPFSTWENRIWLRKSYLNCIIW